MSYDLYFRHRSGTGALTPSQFAAYFHGRPYYTVSETQAWYEHPATGVYFSFSYDVIEGDADESLTGAEDRTSVSFNLNYHRPHTFGLEAEPEVAAFVQHFNLQVSDPQSEGMGDGEYDTAGFLRGWNHGNAFAYRALLTHQPDPAPYMLPGATLEQWWRWNVQRERLERELEDAVFVPRIMFVLVEDVLHSTVVWGDGIPIAIPEVDVLLVPRLRPTASVTDSDAFDTVVIDRGEIDRQLAAYPRRMGPAPYRLVWYHATPPAIRAWLDDRPLFPGRIEGIAPDQVLTAELVAQVRAR